MSKEYSICKTVRATEVITGNILKDPVKDEFFRVIVTMQPKNTLCYFYGTSNRVIVKEDDLIDLWCPGKPI